MVGRTKSVGSVSTVGDTPMSVLMSVGGSGGSDGNGVLVAGPARSGSRSEKLGSNSVWRSLYTHSAWRTGRTRRRTNCR